MDFGRGHAGEPIQGAGIKNNLEHHKIVANHPVGYLIKLSV
jgi:hypothetical protein